MGQVYRIDFGARKLVPVEEKPIEAPKANAYVPAYCDPNNETRGAKFDKRLSTKDIAALVRKDIAAAIKSGAIPKGVKVSVRYESFSGGSALRVNVTALPEGWRVFNPERLRFEKEQPHEIPPRNMARFTPETSALLSQISDLAMAYNRNNSDSMTDYFDVNYYGGDADLWWELESEIRKREEAGLGL